jgi:hypothetical protein
LSGLLVPSLKDFLAFLYFPHATSSILPFLLRFLLVLLVPSLQLGNSSPLFSNASHSSSESSSLPALHVEYLDLSFDHLVQKVVSSQQV